MTHFNHEWDTTRTPAVPVAVGDRYYAQDLNDDFDFLEDNAFALVKGMLAYNSDIILDLSWSYNASTHILTISKLSVITKITVPTVADEEFSVPPVTTTRSKYIVAHLKSSVAVEVPVESLSPSVTLKCDIIAQKTCTRNKALVTETLDSRVEYVIQNVTFGGSASSEAVKTINIGIASGSAERRFFPTYTDILRTYITGIAHYDLKKACIYPTSFNTVDFGAVYQTFSNSIGAVMGKTFTEYCIGEVSNMNLNGVFSYTIVNSKITISTSGLTNKFKMKNCTIILSSTHPPMNVGLLECELTNCDIQVNDSVQGASGYSVTAISNCKLTDCVVYIRSIGGGVDVYTLQSVGIKNSECRRCDITIDTIGTSSGEGVGLQDTKVYDSQITITQVGTSGYTTGSSGLLNCNLDNCVLFVKGVGSSGGSYVTDYFLRTCAMWHCTYHPVASPTNVPRVGYQLNGAHNHFASISGSEVSFTKGKYNSYNSYMTGDYVAIN